MMDWDGPSPLVHWKEQIMADAKKVATDIATSVWGDIAPTIPDVIKEITGPTEVVLQGKHKEETQKILDKMEADLVAFKKKEIDRIEFIDLVQRRKAAVFALYNANKIANQKPSTQKILSAMESIAMTIIVKAIPIILAAAL